MPAQLLTLWSHVAWQSDGVVDVVQIVVVKGSNPAGACIVAHQLYTSISSPMPQSSLDQLQQHAEATGVAKLAY